MSYFALHTKMYKTGKDRSPRVSTDALMNEAFANRTLPFRNLPLFSTLRFY